jgi:hypothetical protein
MRKSKSDLGPPGPKRRELSGAVLSPTVLALTSWALADDEDRPLVLTLPGQTSHERRTQLQQLREGELRFHPSIVVETTPASVEWVNQPFSSLFLERMLHLPMPHIGAEIMAPWYSAMAGAWDLLWSLVAVEEFVLDEPLREVVDKPFYLVHDVHRMLWEIRFLAREQPDLRQAKNYMKYFLRWLLNEPLGEEGQAILSSVGIKRLVARDVEKMDVACFLLALVGQNGLLERTIVYFDDLELALQPNKRPVLRHLVDLLACHRRWSRLGSNPLSILFGFSGSVSDMQLLTKLNPVLAAEVKSGLVWVRGSLAS